MPISDQEGYEKGHFTRVYKHLIIPACKSAGFIPIRADDEVKTNHIVIDIIKKILESDIVLCDLSAKNPNVMYELGIRQAFNKKTVLIKDNKTSRIFDIQGLRTIDYDENLRIDEVQTKIESISKTLKETTESKKDDINSLIQLLSIKPAVLPENYEISKESNLVLSALNDISKRLAKIEGDENPSSFNRKLERAEFKINGQKFYSGNQLFDSGNNHKKIGKLITVEGDTIYYHNLEGELKSFNENEALYERIDSIPF
jgi:hypothetical protein